jgi:hypothetical protein
LVNFQKDAHQIECFHHIAHRYQREIAEITFAILFKRKRTGTAVTRTNHVHAHDKIVIWVEAFAGTEQTFPPFVNAVITGKRVAYPHHV